VSVEGVVAEEKEGMVEVTLQGIGTVVGPVELSK